MEEYIKRSDVLNNVEELKKSPWYNDDYGFGLKQARQEGVSAVVDLCIRDVSALNVKEIIYSKWVKMKSNGSYWYACSKCGHDIPKNTWGNDWFSNWCPNCGAKMICEGEEE